MKGYLHAALTTIETIKPVGLAFFTGKLSMSTLLPEKLIMALLMLMTGKRPKDYRNWGPLARG